MKAQEYLLKQSSEFLGFLKTRVPVYHLSNIFFRDVHYAVIDFLRAQGMKVKYAPAEFLARMVIEKLEKQKILVKLDRQTWMVQHPEYRTPVRKSAPAPAPAKPAAPAPPVPGAAGTPGKPASAATTAGSAPASSAGSPSKPEPSTAPSAQ